MLFNVDFIFNWLFLPYSKEATQVYGWLDAISRKLRITINQTSAQNMLHKERKICNNIWCSTEIIKGTFWQQWTLSDATVEERKSSKYSTCGSSATILFQSDCLQIGSNKKLTYYFQKITTTSFSTLLHQCWAVVFRENCVFLLRR